MRRQPALVRTLCAVAEGKAERVQLEHLKRLFAARGAGLTVKVMGGFGKGGKGVLDYTLACTVNVEFDTRMALLDTHTDWDDHQRARAAAAGIIAVESQPRLEAWLLKIHGIDGHYCNAGHKVAFERQFGGPAHDCKVLERHFGAAVVLAARARVEPLDKLLVLIGARVQPGDPRQG